MSIRQQGWKQTTPHFRRVSINRAMCLRSVQKGLKESHSSIVFSLDICKKKDLNMEQRCVQLFWKWVEKILQYHYTLCYVYLLVKPLHIKAVLLFFFFCTFFGLSQKMAGAFVGSSMESLKARHLHQRVRFFVCFLFVFIDSVLASDEMIFVFFFPFPLENPWFIRGEGIFLNHRKGSCGW